MWWPRTALASKPERRQETKSWTRIAHAPALAFASILRDPVPIFSRVLLRSLGMGVAIHLSTVLQRSTKCHLQNTDVVVERAEWAAASSAGTVTAVAGAVAVHRAGARPLLAVGFLLTPAVYVTLAAREHLVLLRASHSKLYDSLAIALCGSLPLLLVPASLRMLLAAPLALPPLCDAWLVQHEGAGHTSELGRSIASGSSIVLPLARSDMQAATSLYAGAALGAVEDFFSQHSIAAAAATAAPAPATAATGTNSQLLKTALPSSPLPPSLSLNSVDQQAETDETDKTAVSGLSGEGMSSSGAIGHEFARRTHNHITARETAYTHAQADAHAAHAIHISGAHSSEPGTESFPWLWRWLPARWALSLSRGQQGPHTDTSAGVRVHLAWMVDVPALRSRVQLAAFDAATRLAQAVLSMAQVTGWHMPCIETASRNSEQCLETFHAQVSHDIDVWASSSGASCPMEQPAATLLARPTAAGVAPMDSEVSGVLHPVADEADSEQIVLPSAHHAPRTTSSAVGSVRDALSLALSSPPAHLSSPAATVVWVHAPELIGQLCSAQPHASLVAALQSACGSKRSSWFDEWSKRPAGQLWVGAAMDDGAHSASSSPFFSSSFASSALATAEAAPPQPSALTAPAASAAVSPHFLNPPPTVASSCPVPRAELTPDPDHEERTPSCCWLAALCTPLGNPACLSRGARATALLALSELTSAVAPAIETRRTLRLAGEASDAHLQQTDQTLETFYQLGLLPCSPSALQLEDVVEGLEPVLGRAADGSAYYQCHFEWFRWFASGDLMLLAVLLALRELS